MEHLQGFRALKSKFLIFACFFEESLSDWFEIGTPCAAQRHG